MKQRQNDFGEDVVGKVESRIEIIEIGLDLEKVDKDIS